MRKKLRERIITCANFVDHAGWINYTNYKTKVIIVLIERGKVIMAVNYKKLWKLLIDKDMKKKDLAQLAKISNTSIAKMGRNENVTMDVLVKICTALHCEIGDIVEITPDEQ